MKHQDDVAASKRGLRGRIRYRFDVTLSRGPIVVVAWLGLLTAALTLVATFAITLPRLTGVMGEKRTGFADALYATVLRILMIGDLTSDTGVVARTLGVVVTVVGVVIAGTLIGLLASAVEQRIDELRKGRSDVLEDDHTVILGWSPRVATIVKELITANESRRRAAIVVLADRDKVEMEDELRDAIEDFKTTRLVCRTGDVSAPADLARVNVLSARSAIVLGESDDHVAKTLLALRASGSTAPVVAELSDPEMATSVRSLFGSSAAIVSSSNVIGELTAQACRQRGLSQVFHELLDFDGDELYIAPFEQLTGRTYGDALLAFDTSSVLGILSADGALELNPPTSRVLRRGDQLIGVAGDDSEFVLAANPVRGDVHPPASAVEDKPARRIVIVGWSHLGPRVVSELDRFGDAETVVHIHVAEDTDLDEVRDSLPVTNLSIELTATSLRPERISSTAAQGDIHQIIVLGDRATDDPGAADTRTLLTLLAFQQVVERRGGAPVRIVAELLEERHTSLALATGADDFIVSDALASLMIAQISERIELATIFQRLFDSDGATVELIAADALGADACRTYADVVATVAAEGHTAIGYRIEADRTVTINPPKSKAVELREGDEVVVVRTTAARVEPETLGEPAAETFEDAFAALAAEHPVTPHAVVDEHR